MKILIIAPLNKESWVRHLGDSFNEYGYQVDYFNYLRVSYSVESRIKRAIKSRILYNRFLSPFIYKYIGRKLISKVSTNKYDLIILTALKFIRKEFVAEIKKYSKLVGIFNDAVVNMNENMFPLIDLCTLFYVKDPFIIEQLYKVGYNNVKLLHQAANHKLHYKKNLAKDTDIVMFGSGYEYRQKMILEILDFIKEKNYSLRLYGSQWHKADIRLKPYIANRVLFQSDKTDTINRARIVINEHHFGEVEGLNLRFFETAACGTLQLAGMIRNEKTLTSIWPPVQKIIFKSITELRSKLEYYLQHEQEREELAGKLSEVIHNQHTYKQRTEQILRDLDLL